jgi:plasmid stabilization system protein ParE
VQTILWTNSAKISFQKNIDWLRQEWSDKEADKFIHRTEEMLSVLKRHPEMCRTSAKRKNVRIGILDKHTQVIYGYQPRKKQIVLLLFWGMKQNPAKFKY